MFLCVNLVMYHVHLLHNTIGFAFLQNLQILKKKKLDRQKYGVLKYFYQYS